MKNFTPKKFEQMCEMYRNGMEVSRIASKLHEPVTRIEYYLLKSGLVENHKEQCRSCKYGTATGYCNYILITGKRRQCSPVNCEKLEVGERLESLDNSINDPICLQGKIKYEWFFTTGKVDF